jgi:hypothetical protein
MLRRHDGKTFAPRALVFKTGCADAYGGTAEESRLEGLGRSHLPLTTMPGDMHENRRHLFKTLLDSAWKFANWLTHSKGSMWHDAEAGFSATENALGLAISAVIRHMRGVPDQCPACGSHRLSPLRGYRDDALDMEWERPICDKCGWAGKPVLIDQIPQPPEEPQEPAEGECMVPAVPLRKLLRPA